MIVFRGGRDNLAFQAVVVHPTIQHPKIHGQASFRARAPCVAVPTWPRNRAHRTANRHERIDDRARGAVIAKKTAHSTAQNFPLSVCAGSMSFRNTGAVR
jgi:hypothetical protein